jgi:aerobic-type carbon monoxide dehydrogenase small subunit (CoxS/CutS family)
MSTDATQTTRTLRLTINGEAREVEIDGRMLLVEAIRDAAGLKGTHIGCLTGDCGACTVTVDGAVVKSCLLLAVQAEGADVVTIEGIARDGDLTTLQQAFWDEYGFQCGYCLPGMLFCAQELLDENPEPTDQEIRDAIDGNLCRCTGYEFIVRAVRVAAENLRG